MATIRVNSPNVYYTENHIAVDYEYKTTNVQKSGDTIVVSTIFVCFFSSLSHRYLFSIILVLNVMCMVCFIN